MEPEYPFELSPELATPGPDLAPELGGAEPSGPVRDRGKLRELELYFAKRRGAGYAPNLDGYAVQDYVERLLAESPPRFPREPQALGEGREGA